MPAADAFLYRGVHARHPEFANALRGLVRPGDSEGHATAEEHNRLDVDLAFSPFTSWTTNFELARSFARKGGVVLRVLRRSPLPGEEWSWHWSPDLYFEEEILLFGARADAEIVERL